MWHAAKQEIRTFAEFIGLPGFIMKSSYNALYPDKNKGKDVYLQGSRQMDSLSRQYYERSLGAGMFVSPMTENGLVGYSEPFRRFVQHEGFAPQVNEIKNDMPSWIPGDDHLIDFKKGDPYTKVDEGYARLPGAGATSIYMTRCFSPANTKTSLARQPTTLASHSLVSNSALQLYAKVPSLLSITRLASSTWAGITLQDEVAGGALMS